MDMALGQRNHQLLSDLHNAVANLDHLCFDELPPDERADALRELDAVRTSLEARFSGELHDFARPEILRHVGVSSMSGWLVAATGTSRADAGRRATLANTLDELPFLRDAMLEGEVPVDAARVIARALNPRTRRLFDIFTQAAFVDAARCKPLDRLAADVERWLDRHDPDGPAPDDPTADSLHASAVGDRVVVRGDLCTSTGLPLLAALDEEMAKIRAAEPRDPDGGRPFRSAANRRAEALANLTGRGAAAPDSTTRREPAFVAIEEPSADGRRFALPDGTIIPTRLAETWALRAYHLTLRFADPESGMTARFVDADGNLIADLDLGRTLRYANRAQRRALAVRDRHCAFPGCDRNHRSCDAHHLVWWEHGGPTDLDNLVLLCRFHHVLIHTGMYRVDPGLDHRPVFRVADPDTPDWTGPVVDEAWFRHPPDAPERRRPSPN